MKVRRNRYLDEKKGEYFYPIDEELDIDRAEISKSFAKLLCLVNIFIPFEHGLKFIKEALGIVIPKGTLESISYKIGNILRGYHQQNLTTDEKIKLFDGDNKNPDVQYLFTDGGLTPVLEKIDRKANKAKSKHAENKKVGKELIIQAKNEKVYRETKLGLFFTSDDIERKTLKSGKEQVKIKNKRFVASLAHGLEHFKRAVQKSAQLHKTFCAKIIVFISDGSEWCKTIQSSVFPNSIRILDWQ